MKKRPTRSGRVLASVTRSIFEPKVGSVNWNPAPPRVRRAGIRCTRRSVIALYVRGGVCAAEDSGPDRKSTRLNSSHLVISYAVFCLKKKKHREYQLNIR